MCLSNLSSWSQNENFHELNTTNFQIRNFLQQSNLHPHQGHLLIKQLSACMHVLSYSKSMYYGSFSSAHTLAMSQNHSTANNPLIWRWYLPEPRR